jgi:hypothetical protein
MTYNHVDIKQSRDLSYILSLSTYMGIDIWLEKPTPSVPFFWSYNDKNHGTEGMQGNHNKTNEKTWTYSTLKLSCRMRLSNLGVWRRMHSMAVTSS